MNKLSSQQSGKPSLPENSLRPFEQSNSLERRREERSREMARQRARRNILLGLAGGTLGVTTLGILIAVLAINGVFFASRLADPDYPPIDGVPCQMGEMLTNHYHAHVKLYINGKDTPIPAYIGIVGVDASNPYAPPICFYWLHTHDASGLIHIESPPKLQFTLGNFLDIWSKKFPHASPSGFPSEFNRKGWTVYIDGVKQPARFDFRTIVFKPHLLITLAYNSPDAKPERLYNWGPF